MARPLAQLASGAARALGFAHLAGVGARASTDDEKDDKDKDAKADDSEPEKKDDDEGDSKGSKGAKGSKAEGDDNKPDDEDDDKDKDAKADDSEPDAEDEDPDEEMRGKSAAAAARRRERARCAAIFGSKHATGRVPLAAHFAFNTSMTRSEAIAALRDAPIAAATRTPNTARQAANPAVSTNGGAAPSQRAAVAKSLDAAFAAVNPSRKTR